MTLHTLQVSFFACSLFEVFSSANLSRPEAIRSRTSGSGMYSILLRKYPDRARGGEAR